jgi:hypothetical protein
VIVCACVFATVHDPSLCGQFDRGTVYCTALAAELPHGLHHERPLFPSGPYTTIAAVGSTSSTSSTGTLWSGGSFPITG